MSEDARVSIPIMWCTCGKQMFWCDVRHSYVDSGHRASHDVPVDDGRTNRRQPHNTQGAQA